MYNDTIKVANKIISDNDLEEIFDKMNNEILECEQICKKETELNEKYEREYQKWTTKDFKGGFKTSIDFYDDTNISIDNYDDFMITFNNRINEIKYIHISYNLWYDIQNGNDTKYIHQYIEMHIYERKMSLDIKISSEDKRINNVYEFIKSKILNAPEKYDRIIKDKSKIINKITFAVGSIPSIIICLLLIFVPVFRQVYGLTYVLYPLAVIVLSFIIGGIFIGGKIDSLYSSIVPSKKYAGYDSSTYKSIYKDDIDDYVNSSEIIIGKNINNIKNRKEIEELETKYSKYIPYEVLAILVLSIFVVIIGKLI